MLPFGLITLNVFVLGDQYSFRGLDASESSTSGASREVCSRRDPSAIGAIFTSLMSAVGLPCKLTLQFPSGQSFLVVTNHSYCLEMLVDMKGPTLILLDPVTVNLR